MMTMRPVPAARLARFLLAFSSLILSGCGVASISPFVSLDDQEFDPALLGRWQSTESTEFAIISGDSTRGYQIAYVDEDGARGRFDARLGRLGRRRVFDVVPMELDLSREGPVFESLILRLHSFVIIDSVSPTDLFWRGVDADSLRAVLARDPDAPHHTVPHGEQSPVITAPTDDVRRFFDRLLELPGMTTDSVRYVHIVHK